MKNYQGAKIIQEVKSLFHGKIVMYLVLFLFIHIHIISKEPTLHTVNEYSKGTY